MKKKILSILISILALCTCMFTFTACVGNVEFKINFVVDEQVYATVNTSGSEIIRMPENPTKEDYTFDGWFWDKDVWEKPFTANSLLDAPLSSDMSVYAKFSPIHVCSFTEEIVNNDYIATNATCEDKATYYYSCTCGAKGTETFESGEALGHSFTNYVYNNDAKCEQDGTQTAVCDNGCGVSSTIPKLDTALVHSFTNYVYNNDADCEIDGTETARCDNGCGKDDTRTKAGSALEHDYSAWVTNNNGTHTRTCSHNNSHKETKNCNGGTASCQSKAVCVDCNTEYGSLAGHVAKEEWSTTNKIHYHACKTQGCTEKLDKENHTFDKNKKCTVCDYVTTELMWTEISSDVFEINGTNLFVKVPNKQTYFAFAETINIAEGATYKVYTDIQCKEDSNIPSYMVNDLEIGDNTYYFLVSNEGSFPKIYTVTVRRRLMYDVTFSVNGGTAVDKQVVEEDDFATEPTTTKTGYTFDGWDYDFTAPITQKTNITASWTANKDTKYTIIYYLQNLNDNNYTPYETLELKGTTDTTATAEIKEYAHFTYYSYNSTISGNIDGNGSRVLSVYYTRDSYAIVSNSNNAKAGTITKINSNYKYEKEITLTATTNIGYTWLGWYEGENLVYENEEFNFKAEKDVTYTATWETNEYSITYELNGGENNQDNVGVYTVETATITLLAPTKTGYTFNGWFTEETFENQVTKITLGTYGDKTFYAKWILTEYNVTYAVVNKQKEITFDYNYSGVDPTTVTLFLDEILAYPAEPSRSGYIFRGWFLDAACTQRFSFNEKIECDLTLYAGWQAHYTSGYSHTNINPVNYNSSSYSYSITASGTSSSNQHYVYLVAKESGTHKLYYKNSSSSSYYYTYIGATNVTAGKTIKSTSYCSSTSYNYVSFTCSAGDVIRINIYRYNTSSYSNYGTAYFYFEGFNNRPASTACSNGIFNYENYNIETPTFSLITPTRAGYTFNGWFTEETFENKVTEVTLGSYGDKTFYAKWTARDDTKYIVNYYLQNLEDDEYTLHEFVELKGVTDTLATADIREYTQYTCNESLSEISGNIDGNGSCVLSVYYTRNKYKITVNNANAGSITNSGSYKYGKEITITAKPYLGYEFVGWYSEDELLSTETTYTFTVDKNVIAKFEVVSEMANFNFTSTATTCKITGIVDNTVTEIIVPDYVTSISKGAFAGCSSLTSITIPFVGGSKKTSSSTYQYPFGYIFGTSNYTGSYSAKQYYYGSSTSSTTNSTYYIPTSLKSVTITGGNILYGAFYNCTSLTSIEIGNSVTSIGDSAFQYCNNLISITIPFVGSDLNARYEKSIFGYIFGYVVKSNSSAVYGATYQYLDSYYDVSKKTQVYDYYHCYIPTSLRHVTILGGEIQSHAFQNCSSLISVTIGDSVTSIGYDAFYGCSKLTKVNYTGTIDQWVQIEFGNGTANPLYYAEKLYINNELVTQANITTSTKINDYAFYNCSSLTSIEIPNSVTIIGSSAFSCCSKLTSIEIPNSVTSIGSDAFYNCSSLTNVVIPDSVTSIGNRAFYGCSSLTSIVIPDSVTSIGDYAFSGCTSLTSIEIPDSATSIGSSAFYNCSSLTNVVIPDSVTSIGNRAFYGCSSLTSIVIPDSVTSIGYDAFYGCSSLTSVTFKDTSTWYRTTSYYNWTNKTGGTQTSVTNPSTNAKYFTSTYYEYYWYKK